MSNYFTDEIQTQIVIALLKAHNIKKIVASPGTTNIPFNGSIQSDPFFEIYSSVDERSAAYIAVGLAKDSKEPVVLSCTGATASRNYMSGLTEAFYSKLPIIALTCSNSLPSGNLTAQITDRTQLPSDIARISVQLPIVKDKSDFWFCNYLVNKALLESVRKEGGPVHINLPTLYLGTFTTKTLPKVQVVNRFYKGDIFPSIDKEAKICVFIGARHEFTENEVEVLEEFVKKYDAVVFGDHTSGYEGFGKVQTAIAGYNFSVGTKTFSQMTPNLIIHIGEISGDYDTMNIIEHSNSNVWRVSEDGEMRDKFKKLENIFEMSILDFFKMYNSQSVENNSNFYELWEKYCNNLRTKIVESDIPFSNNWIAKITTELVPEKSTIHFGILNSLRSWNYYNFKNKVNKFSNIGGFGIDGTLSTLLGTSLVNKDGLNIAVLGDLSFFYDMNVLGNRHIGKNIRILLVNNGKGVEFRLSGNHGSQFEDRADNFIAAGGHFVGESGSNVTPAKSWVESLGFKYISADSKEGFLNLIDEFLSNKSDKPILFECFTNHEDEDEALSLIRNLDTDRTSKQKGVQMIRNILPKKISGTLENKVKDRLGKI